MKKLFATLCLFALIITSCFSFSACSDSITGTYKVSSVTAMGLKATQSSFSEYSKNRSETEKENNSYYKPVSLLLDIELTLKKGGKGKIYIKDFLTVLGNDPHFVDVVEQVSNGGYVTKDGDLLVENIEYIKDKKTGNKDAYFIYPVNEAGERINFSDIWGNGVFIMQQIHATIKNGRLACEMTIALHEKEGDAAQMLLSTNAIVQMKK